MEPIGNPKQLRFGSTPPIKISTKVHTTPRNTRTLDFLFVFVYGKERYENDLAAKTY